MIIPRKLHWIWIGSEVPAWVNRNFMHWLELNPGIEWEIHGVESLLPKYRALYRQMEDVCSKADLIRLSVLEKHGGWYFDADFVPLKPIEEIYRDFDLDCGCFLTKQWEIGEKRIANGVIGIAKDAPIWDTLHALIEKRMEGSLERTSFGPLLVTEAVTRCPDVAIAQVQEFYPLRFNPKGIAIAVYKVLLRKGFAPDVVKARFKNGSYAFHLWCGGKEYEDEELDKLSEVLKYESD